jgi:hypothetical protein
MFILHKNGFWGISFGNQEIVMKLYNKKGRNYKTIKHLTIIMFSLDKVSLKTLATMGLVYYSLNSVS